MFETKIESRAERAFILGLTAPDKPLIQQAIHTQTHQQKDCLTCFA